MPEAIGWRIQTKLNFNIKERILKSYIIRKTKCYADFKQNVFL